MKKIVSIRNLIKYSIFNYKQYNIYISHEYLSQFSARAMTPLSLTLHQLASTRLRLEQRAEACNKMRSPVKKP